MIKILDLSYRQPKARKSEYPFLIVNCVFRLSDSEEGNCLKIKALSLSRETTRVLASDSEENLEKGDWKWMWTFSDPVWRHIPKFDVFWLRTWVSDCPVTRAALSELREYEQNGSLSTAYRQLDGGVILRHLQTLDSYWD
jgi:hypothetical protein